MRPQDRDPLVEGMTDIETLHRVQACFVFWKTKEAGITEVE